jgi:hypothetical protein
VKLLGGAAVLLAIGAGLGTYFALRGPSTPPVPKAQQNPILERAQSKGIIDGYKVMRFDPRVGTFRYAVTGSPIELKVQTCGDSAGPCIGSTLFIDYRHTVAQQAGAILKIAQTHNPVGQKIIFGPPYYP